MGCPSVSCRCIVIEDGEAVEGNIGALGGVVEGGDVVAAMVGK